LLKRFEENNSPLILINPRKKAEEIVRLLENISRQERARSEKKEGFSDHKGL
jgi:hypothetical protein